MNKTSQSAETDLGECLRDQLDGRLYDWFHCQLSGPAYGQLFRLFAARLTTRLGDQLEHQLFEKVEKDLQ